MLAFFRRPWSRRHSYTWLVTNTLGGRSVCSDGASIRVLLLGRGGVKFSAVGGKASASVVVVVGSACSSAGGRDAGAVASGWASVVAGSAKTVLVPWTASISLKNPFFLFPFAISRGTGSPGIVNVVVMFSCTDGPDGVSAAVDGGIDPAFDSA